MIQGLTYWQRIARTGPNDRAVTALAADFWKHGVDTLGASTLPIVRPSLPIAWFGDLAAFQRSPVRIITVGLNPSRIEFPASSPFQRFPAWARLTPLVSTFEPARYVAGLNQYFHHDPYLGWFDRAYRDVLAAMSASFAPARDGDPPRAGSRFAVLHTDLYSPMATDPTWSRLGTTTKRTLARPGVELWRRLVTLLEPDMVIASLRQEAVDHIAGHDLAWRSVYQVAKAQPWEARVARWPMNDSETILVHAPAQTLPFGPFTNKEKAEIGSRLAIAWRMPKPSRLLIDQFNREGRTYATQRLVAEVSGSTRYSPAGLIYKAMGASDQQLRTGVDLDRVLAAFVRGHSHGALELGARSWPVAVERLTRDGLNPLQIAAWLDENWAL